MNLVQTIILSIIEGITEFLPISSTGHMILASSVMHIADDKFVEFFEVAVQLGAILSVLVLYWKRFFQTTQFYFKLFLAFIPAAFFGLIFSSRIDKLFENPVGVASALVIGGIILLFVDKWFHDDEHKQNTTPSHKSSFIIGLFQVISLFPGVSRSAATIIGGLSQKLSRRAAAEFSFFLAVPTMFAATGWKLFKFYKDALTTVPSTSIKEIVILHKHIKYPINLGFKPDDINHLIIGNIIAFAVAMLAIKFFISFLSKNGFRVFGIYRIIVGIIFLVLYYSGKGIFGKM